MFYRWIGGDLGIKQQNDFGLEPAMRPLGGFFTGPTSLSVDKVSLSDAGRLVFAADASTL
ncbi:hypothetical protein [Sinorhizobium fredii]|uniref:Uncharacterized protein n=1 Tax=Rhizobium fredii TaxID=380 RepID=A0A844A4B3_RHIFR|nr:hypothetical protein [Sinorhizobium fredii]ASY71322.1 hypothetical protein SF83666_c39350 [Sinorhizobium fredii CCBAU 83666]AWM27393.1 hypothetical protein AOX55_00004172 [Sinorhizobium fredii CCBAU 25509]KSV87799.1 hypothetical protein N181_17745 [Sinorhizobium fredii USDA 205]MCG5475923.1 hypothetical protein [Sinorhizobium fredii]MQW97317.1 hypothetical protein [Sinorhizobium fredii]